MELCTNHTPLLCVLIIVSSHRIEKMERHQMVGNQGKSLNIGHCELLTNLYKPLTEDGNNNWVTSFWSISNTQKSGTLPQNGEQLIHKWELSWTIKIIPPKWTYPIVSLKELWIWRYPHVSTPSLPAKVPKVHNTTHPQQQEMGELYFLLPGSAMLQWVPWVLQNPTPFAMFSGDTMGI